MQAVSLIPIAIRTKTDFKNIKQIIDLNDISHVLQSSAMLVLQAKEQETAPEP
jgi:hypothetical protein